MKARKMLYSFASGIIITTTVLTAFTGCAKNEIAATASEESNLFAYDEGGVSPSGETVSCFVTAVEENTISLTVGGPAGGPQGNGEAPEKPDGEAPEKPDGEAPEKPDGEAPEKPDGETPEKPDGEAPEKPDGEALEMPSEQEQGQDNQPGGSNAKTATLKIEDESVITKSGEQASISDITEGTMLSITFDNTGNITSIEIMDMSEMGQGGPSAQTGVDSYDAVTEFNSNQEISGESYESTGTDENAVQITDGATVSLKDVTVSRISDDSTGGVHVVCGGTL